MSDVIKLLPDALANQIAAGEVVQRPASAVKELLENAVDAGATAIKLIVKEAGRSLIQVIDDGAGMSETDVRMSLERHATSKISHSEDLFSIRTFGFRGEALASIAAVSQMEIKTRREDRNLGTLLVAEASEVKKQEPAAGDKGTSICVKNLFYNVPARRNFLKSNGVEMRHIIEEFQRVALANPEISFALYQNDTETYNLPAGKLAHRIVHLFGRNYKKQLITCHEELDYIKVHGYVGSPDFVKKTRGEQFFFVNERFIKSNYFNHAVTTAFRGLIPDKSYPFYVLFITIDPKHVDINVHPTKTEVKFDDEKTAYAVVKAAVQQALATHNITPPLDFEADINLGAKLARSRETISEKNYSQFKNTTSPREQSNLENWDRLFDENKGKVSMDQLTQEDEPPAMVTFRSQADDIPDKEKEERSNEARMPLFQLHNRYIISQVKSGMMIMDQQAAHERILFEKFMALLENKSGASQQSLFPQALSLNPSDFALYLEMKEDIAALGFVTEPFGKSDILIKGIPTDLTGAGSEKDVFEGLLDQFKKNIELSLPRHENLARSLALRARMKAGKKLSEQEMTLLIDQLFACHQPDYASKGKRTFYILELSNVDHLFVK